MKILATVFILSGLMACGIRQNTPAVPENAPPPAAIVEGDRILLLSFYLWRDTTTAHGERVEWVGSNTVEGRLKQPLKAPGYLTEGDLICSFYDAGGKVVFVHSQEDPLTTPAEYPNEDGTFGRADIALDKAELFLRVQMTPGLSKLTINKVLNEQRVVQLAEFKL
jgi:hypothetical protein